MAIPEFDNYELAEDIELENSDPVAELGSHGLELAVDQRNGYPLTSLGSLAIREPGQSLEDQSRDVTKVIAEDDFSSDTLQQLLNEAGRHALLKAYEEVVLNKKIEKLKPISWIKDGVPPPEGQDERDYLVYAQLKKRRLTPEQLKELEEEGQSAKKEMANCNLRLVISIAKNYRDNGVPFLDLIQAGTFGLNRAIEKFDWRMGFKFSTYATNWIRQAAQREVANRARTIRMPVHVGERLRKLNRAENQLWQEHNRQPTVEEIAKKAEVPLGHAKEALEAATSSVSLNQTVGDDGEVELGAMLPDDNGLDPAKQVEEDMHYESLYETLKTLGPRHRDVLILRFGLGGGEGEKSLEEVGKIIGVTRERVRQIEVEALKRLKALKIIEDSYSSPKNSNGASGGLSGETVTLVLENGKTKVISIELSRVMKAATQGLSSEQIARNRGLKTAEVERQIKAIMKTVGAANKVEIGSKVKQIVRQPKNISTE